MFSPANNCLSMRCSLLLARTIESQDNVGWATLTGLKPNTHYYYAVVIKGEIVDTRAEVDQPWPSFRTLPDKTSFLTNTILMAYSISPFQLEPANDSVRLPTPTASTLILRLSIHFGNAIVTN